MLIYILDVFPFQQVSGKILITFLDHRPTIAEVRTHTWFTCGLLPASIPVSALTVEPAFTPAKSYKTRSTLNHRLQGKVLTPKDNVMVKVSAVRPTSDMPVKKIQPVSNVQCSAHPAAAKENFVNHTTATVPGTDDFILIYIYIYIV
jgi:hypothetical protein